MVDVEKIKDWHKDIPRAVETDAEPDEPFTWNEDNIEQEDAKQVLSKHADIQQLETIQETIRTEDAITFNFETFYRNFKEKKTGVYKYFQALSAISNSGYPVLEIDANDITLYDPVDEPILPLLYKNIDSALKHMTEAAKILIHEFNPEFDSNQTPVTVRITNFDMKRSLRSIDTDLIDKLVSIDAMVAESTKIKPFILKSAYRCLECDFITYTQKNKVASKCPQCETRKLILDKSHSKFTSFSDLTIQELPDDLPPGYLPKNMTVRIMGKDLTDKCRAGDRVTVTAIVRLGYDGSKTMRELENHDPLGIIDNFGTSFELTLEANNITTLEGTASGNKGLKQILTTADIKKITDLKNSPSLYEDLINSYAPHIFGLEDQKESCLLVVVGAKRKVTPLNVKRGDINCMLVGDPGIAKSELLKFANKIASRSLYTSGRGSSGAGLTAAVIKNETGQFALAAGAVVMADQGLCCIDEFDKMKPEDRSSLHEAMEQQTVSVAKGGINATLNARTAILAAANPVDGVYDPYKSIRENTGLPPSLISRFDIIYAMKDKIDEDKDESIAQAMIDNSANAENIKAPFDVDFLIKYIYYVKHHQKASPKLSNEAALFIKSLYKDYRRLSSTDSNGNTVNITVTPRMVDAMYRIAEARALLLQKYKIEKEDVERARYLINKMYSSFGIDTESGNLNLGIIHGKPLSQMSRTKVLIEILDGETNSGQQDVHEDVLIKALEETHKFHNSLDAKSTIDLAVSKGILTNRGKRTYRFNKDALTPI